MSKKLPMTSDRSTQRSPDRQNPWSRMLDLREEMFSHFGPLDQYRWPSLVPREASFGASFLPWPVLDVSESQEAYNVTAELPGLTVEQIAIRLKNGVLTISGQKSEDTQDKDGSYHLRERSWGRFQRSLALPDGIDSDGISAGYAEGLLTIHIPKSKSSQEAEKTISIQPT